MVKNSSVLFLLLVGTAIVACIAAKQTDICENETGRLRCRGSETIRIKNAWYGSTRNSNCRGDTERCNTLEKADKDTLDRMRNRCNRKGSCDLTPANRLWGSDPCPGTAKLLRVEYDCK
ncbi:PREDICTED: adhesion G protein-coupled receptor L1-like [Priapulus caudatus]|uniref:Adhesion G protein-coupled receptor L1-like n=1 Tax=Priapulus caudatus TaxID=37621 RepID=A0ABM1DZU6_PRICU|nr:PREDICTED: adhesion G protein-coupled receptor L1-like [Priapulus caudatus]